VARAYLDYWQALAKDPSRPEMKAFNDPRPKLPAGRPVARLTTIFSPRTGLDPLDWYVRLAESAKQGVFLTAAFGLTDELRPVFEEQRRYLRYLLLDLRDGKIEAMRRDPSNVVAAGGMKGKGAFRKWIASKLQRLNMNVDYIHAKFMLIDPLTPDPIVITGSANWSDESVNDNDENMVVIRGDTRVADIYLTEFMRLFNHYRLPARARSPHLDPGDGWARPFFEKGSSESKERLLFR
jgi:phosphatidylserine/phosphatidylglycerophosphate/cardiolipin synthase-like enzyme